MRIARAGMLAVAIAGAGCASTQLEGASPPAVKAALSQISADVSEASLRTYIERMVGFGTRHTLSDAKSDTRGIGAARRWVASASR